MSERACANDKCLIFGENKHVSMNFINEEILVVAKNIDASIHQDAYIRLVTSYLMEYSEEWSAGRSYIQLKIIEQIQEKRRHVT